MTPEAIRAAIMGSIAATWATKTVIDMPNRPFTAPSNAAWICPRIKMGDSFIGELGDDGVGLRTGVLMINIFVPPGSGLTTANGYANTLEGYIRRKDISGVRFDEPNTEDLGVDEGNGFYHLLVSCNLNTWVGE